MPSGLCDEVAIIAGGKVPFAGPVDVARDRIRPQVRLETREQDDGPWRAALPADARHEGSFWYFTLPESGVEPLLRALIEGEAGILACRSNGPACTMPSWRLPARRRPARWKAEPDETGG
jgi:ABC-2 type transport system ATP-binding protein